MIYFSGSSYQHCCNCLALVSLWC